VHGGQVRKGTSTPYIAHLLAVAATVLEYDGSEDMAIAALLHDAVEDQGGAARLADIHNRFGNHVADIVHACSDSVADTAGGQPKEDWANRPVTGRPCYYSRVTARGFAGLIQPGLPKNPKEHAGQKPPGTSRVKDASREDTHAQNQTDVCGRRALWRPYSERRIRNAYCTASGIQYREDRASALGLRPLRPVLVATELLWCLRLLSSPPLLASPLLAPPSLLVMPEGGVNNSALFTMPASNRRVTRQCDDARATMPVAARASHVIKRNPD
jgi:HD domain-containing protein